MKKTRVGIIGGGAAGLVAALSASRAGASVVLCEKMPQLGKKLLISGNGRCNLSNDSLSENFYKKSARPLVKSVFSKFGKNDILNFFNGLGLRTHSRDGRIFPVTNQASSVLRVLETELKRLSIQVELNFEAVSISAGAPGFLIGSKDGKTVKCGKVIITGGGRTYPALGSDGKIYELARRMGHDIIEPVPAAVPVVAKDRLCHFLQGQKIFVDSKSIINGKPSSGASGELLFTQYGLSGTAILDISGEISVAINRDNLKDVIVSVDMVPFMKREELKEELDKRLKKGPGREDLLTGILPNKFNMALRDEIKGLGTDGIIKILKSRQFKVTGTRGWNEAEFTDGGIDITQLSGSTLESGLEKGVYFAGEILDVGGKRGGYHLAWAWASGFVAGLTNGYA